MRSILSRRDFLRLSGMTLLGTHLPSVLSRALGAQPGKSGKSLIVLFQRGAADGLSILPPLADPHYRACRPNLALDESGEGAALKLDGFFGLHPALDGLKPFWDEGSLAFVHQAGSPEPTRSHFDAQDFMESGAPGNKSVEDGYLNRAMTRAPRARASELRAVALQASLPRALYGKFPALAMDSLQEFGGGLKNPNLASGFEAMYRGAVDQALRGVGTEAFQALKTLTDTSSRRLASEGEGRYPKGPLGKHLSELAQLIKADVGLQLGVTECGGWDTHVNQGGAQGQLAARLKELGDGLAAFAGDLGPRLADVVVVVMTEFGRTARENGNRGTDHGHGSVMMVLGGEVRGRRIHARWKGLEESALFEKRDLPVIHDYRDVMAELLSRHLGISELGTVFPKHPLDRSRWPGLLRA